MLLNFCFNFISQIINGRYVDGFYIYARSIDDTDDGEPSYIMQPILLKGASTCTVSGLKKFTTYEFFIVPFYKAVEGKPSNSRIARTLEDGKLIKKKYILLN
jgi:roundabout, axon guidance receptor 2